MTRDEILAESAGPRLDRWVGERVMGLHERRRRGWLFDLVIPGGTNQVDFCKPGDCWSACPKYSTAIRDAWRVVEKLQGRYRVEIHMPGGERAGDDHVEVCLWSDFWEQEKPDVVVQADTLPLAICRAALLSVEGK